MGWGGGREGGGVVVRKDGLGWNDWEVPLSLHTNSVSLGNSHGMVEEEQTCIATERLEVAA